MGYVVKVKESRAVLDSPGSEVRLEQTVEVYADSASDIPEPQENWLAGSACIVMDSQEVKLLSTEGAWL